MAPASAPSMGTGSRRTSTRVKSLVKPPAPAAASPAPKPAASKDTLVSAASSRSLRPRRLSANIYEISDNSDDSESQNGFEDQDSEEDDSQESQDPEVDRPERGSEAGRALRPRNCLATPVGLADYVDTNKAFSYRKHTTKKKKPQVKKRAAVRLSPGRACQACKESRRKCDGKRPRCTGCAKTNKQCLVPDTDDLEGQGDRRKHDIVDERGPSVRSEIRKTLEGTKKKRDAFYIKYSGLFETLLPERNYISKMLERKAQENAPPEDTDIAMKDGPLVDLVKEVNTGQASGEPKVENPNGVQCNTDAAAHDGVQCNTDATAHDGVQCNTDAAAHDAAQPTRAIERESLEATTVEIEVRDNFKTKVDIVDDDVEVVPFELLENQPENVKGTMKEYQLSGLSYLLWLYKNGVSGILGDEMGLGKTLQTLSLFSYLTTYEPTPEGHQRPFLVVCPVSVLSSWIAECKRWTPHLRVLRFHGPLAERARLKKVAESGELIGTADDEGEGRGYDVVVTSYEVFEREKAWFRRAFVWRYVVLDEGHKIKNEKTNISMALQGLAAEYRLILTGTPLQNNLTELWALLHWLYPDVFIENTCKLFSDAFDLTLGKNDLSVMDNARKLLELVMLRRMKESQGVNLGLPTKTELIMFLPLAPMQRFWYKRLLTRLDKGLLEGLFQQARDKIIDEDRKEAGKKLAGEYVVQDQELEEVRDDEWGETRKIVEQAVKESKPTDGKWRKLMNLLMQLRKCCDHPYLLPNAEPNPELRGEHAATIMLASSKMIFLDKLIEELCMKQGRKVLIFSGFTKMLDVCEDFLHLKGGDGTRFQYGRLDGTTPRARRNLAIRLFNNDSTYKIMLISTRAGGLGINLASATDVVMLESDWNPQADLQAQARAHRIGQVNPVTVYRLITQGTVEEQMMGRIRKKLYLSAKVTESMRDIHTQTSSAGLNGDADENLPTLSTGQLMSLVRSGSRAIARPEIDPAEMLKWDWETIIQRCRDYQVKLETESKEGISGETAEEERRWLSEMERVETRVFEGKHHKKTAESNRDIAKEWSRQERRLGMDRVVMIGGHPVLKETIGNNEWEAVKTFAGKDPRLAEPKRRKRKTVEHQDYCQVCFDGGILHTCAGCPRTYHNNCLSPEFESRLKATSMHFYCPQHECVECEQKTVNAGGLIFRCRWCENGYCEDCMNWERTQLLGEQLPELENLGFGPIQQAFWIKCEHCVHRHEVDLDARKICEDMEKGWIEEKERREAAAAELTMEGSTVEGSEVATPVEEVPMPLTGEEVGKKRRRNTMDSPAAEAARLSKKPKGNMALSKQTEQSLLLPQVVGQVMS